VGDHGGIPTVVCFCLLDEADSGQREVMLLSLQFFLILPPNFAGKTFRRQKFGPEAHIPGDCPRRTRTSISHCHSRAEMGLIRIPRNCEHRHAIPALNFLSCAAVSDSSSTAALLLAVQEAANKVGLIRIAADTSMETSARLRLAWLGTGRTQTTVPCADSVR